MSTETTTLANAIADMERGGTSLADRYPEVAALLDGPSCARLFAAAKAAGLSDDDAHDLCSRS
jgi:predicted DNA repair protein MutK